MWRPAVFDKQFTDLQSACAFAEAIVNTVREPLVVLDHDLRVVTASRSFLSPTYKALVEPYPLRTRTFDGAGSQWFDATFTRRLTATGVFADHRSERRA